MATKDSIYCPHCHEHTSLNIRAFFNNEIYSQYQIGECNHCSGCVLIRRMHNGMDYVSDQQIIRVFPDPMPVAVDETIPNNIRTDMSEAYLCLSVGAFRAAATLARRALQVICLEKGADKEKKLHLQIDELFDKNIITDEIKKWAHEIRYVGNDAAHPNDAPVSREDAEEILELLDSVCDVLYTAPAKAENRRKAREANKVAR